MKLDLTFLLKSSFLLLFLFTQILMSSCNNEELELKTFLNKIETEYENIAVDLGIAYWNYYSAEAEADLKTPKDKFYNLLVNDSLNTLIETWYPKRSEIKDSILFRRVEKWHDVLLSAKVEYNAEILELRNDLEKMFEVSDEKENNEEELETKMLKLIELRNKKSVELGYDNYVHLTMETNGIGYDWFVNFIEEMDNSTLAAYESLVDDLKTEKGIDQFGQRNVFQLFGQFRNNNNPTELKEPNNIEMVKTSLANIGIDYNKLPARLVEEQLPPGVGGQGLMINVPNDFRAVMTLGMGISVWMHEMGHGMHGLFNTINNPILEGYEWVPGNANPSFAEGMAETSAWFTRNTEWQKEYTNLSEEQILERKILAKKYAPAFIRFHLKNFLMETEMYLHPEKTYADIQIELSKKYMLVETDDIRTQSLGNIIYVSYPLYLQNYLLADMIACQVHKTLEKEFGTMYAFNKDVGSYLTKHFYSKGEYYSWSERLKHGTGSDLDIDAYLDYYQIK